VSTEGGPANLQDGQDPVEPDLASFDTGVAHPARVPEWRALANPAHLIPCYAGVARKP
jgi:hypothetical protein